MGWLRVNYYNIIGPPLQHPQGSRGLDHFGGRQPYLSLGLLLHVHVIFNKRERERERERERDSLTLLRVTSSNKLI